MKIKYSDSLYDFQVSIYQFAYGMTGSNSSQLCRTCDIFSP